MDISLYSPHTIRILWIQSILTPWMHNVNWLSYARSIYVLCLGVSYAKTLRHSSCVIETVQLDFQITVTVLKSCFYKAQPKVISCKNFKKFSVDKLRLKFTFYTQNEDEDSTFTFLVSFLEHWKEEHTEAGVQRCSVKNVFFDSGTGVFLWILWNF